MENIPYISYYTGDDAAEFAAKLMIIGNQLGFEIDWLPKIMFHESGMNPAAVNPDGGATGLIQFMPSTAAAFYTTTADLAAMNGTDQLDYVYQYFANAIKNAGVQPRTLYQAYLIDFYPAAVGKGSDYKLGTADNTVSAVAAANKPYDLGNKGYITVGDMIEITNNW